jgi:hypothetical protein
MKAPENLKYPETEIWEKVDLIYPLTQDEISDLEQFYDLETIMNVISLYEQERAKKKEEELFYDIKYTLENGFGFYFNKPSEVEIPDFKIFYEEFLEDNPDSGYNKEEVEEKFKKMTTDPRQLKLFEIRNVVRKIIKEAFVDEKGELKDLNLDFDDEDFSDLDLGEIFELLKDKYNVKGGRYVGGASNYLYDFPLEAENDLKKFDLYYTKERATNKSHPDFGKFYLEVAF